MEFGFWALKSKIHLKESGTPPMVEIYMQVPLTKNPESITWNLESVAWNLESKTVWDSLTWCKKLIQMTSGYFPRWQTTPLLILRSSPFSKMACETTFPPWGNFLGFFFVVDILLNNLRWLIYSFKMKTIDFFKVENFCQPQASMALY